MKSESILTTIIYIIILCALCVNGWHSRAPICCTHAHTRTRTRTHTHIYTSTVSATYNLVSSIYLTTTCAHDEWIVHASFNPTYVYTWQVFVRDTFGLRTLYRTNRLTIHALRGVDHHSWHRSKAIFLRCIEPYLK